MYLVSIGSLKKPSPQNLKTFQTRPTMWAKGPTHPSLGQRPRKDRKIEARAESPAHWSIPNISLVVIHTVLVQKHPELILKGPRAVMLLLIVDVCPQRLQIGWADRETAIAALP